MLKRRSTRAFALFATLSCCLVLAQAAESSVKGNRRLHNKPAEGQAAKVASPEGYGNPHHHDEGPRPGYGYEQHGPEHQELEYQYKYSEEEYHGGEGPGYYHKEEHYSKFERNTFCLQEFKRTQQVTAEGEVYYKSDFRCCEPKDDPEFCLHDDYSGPYKEHQHFDMMDGLLNPTAAATCTWVLPTIPEDSTLVNCSISAEGKKCGCPHRLAFSTDGNKTMGQTTSCQKFYDPTGTDGGRRKLAAAVEGSQYYAPKHNTTLFDVDASIIKGEIDEAETGEYYKNIKGTFEFVWDIYPHSNGKRKSKTPANPGKKLPTKPKDGAKPKKNGVKLANADYSGNVPFDPSRDVAAIVTGGQLLITLFEVEQY